MSAQMRTGFGNTDRTRSWTIGSSIAEPDLAAIGESLEPADRSDIEAAVESEIAEAIAFAEASPFPGDEELLDHVFR